MEMMKETATTESTKDLIEIESNIVSGVDDEYNRVIQVLNNGYVRLVDQMG